MPAEPRLDATDALRQRLRANLDAFAILATVDDRLRRAAVAVAIVAGDGGAASFVLTERASSLRNHAGQYALPGGRTLYRSGDWAVVRRNGVQVYDSGGHGVVRPVIKSAAGAMLVRALRSHAP